MLLRVPCRLKMFERKLFLFSTPIRCITRGVICEKISSWQIHSYGGLEELQFTRGRPPIIRNPNDVVVQVWASSVNPLDIAMISGYGSVLLNVVRQAKTCSFHKPLEFPLTLGRDFAGVIVSKGHSVGKLFEVGDEVWGIVPPSDQGAHTEQVLISKCFIEKKPNNISMLEAGSVLYAAVTAWSALKITGNLAVAGARGKTVLVLGGSGGVGTMAVQMLRNWGAHVVTTCSADAVSLLKSLGIHEVIDYKAPTFWEQIGNRKYDIILDCAGIGQDGAAKYFQHLKDYSFSKFITLNSPMLQNCDTYGLAAGMLKNIGDLLVTNISSSCLPKSSSVRWGFFMPLGQALSEITKDVQDGKILPCVHKIYAFEDLPKAYERAAEGHLRGKIVIEIIKGQKIKNPDMAMAKFVGELSVKNDVMVQKKTSAI